MADPYIGEIKLFAGNFAPLNWAFCNGQSMSIAENDVLFNLIGTTYGGDGVTTFNLPDLRSRVPVHQGSGQGGSYAMGEAAGQENVTVSASQMPSHTHGLQATTNGLTASPANAFPAQLSTNQANANLYGTGSAQPTSLSNQAVAPNQGGQPHSNIQPLLCVTFIISLFGTYPSPN